jgi:hypothetical protein
MPSKKNRLRRKKKRAAAAAAAASAGGAPATATASSPAPAVHVTASSETTVLTPEVKTAQVASLPLDDMGKIVAELEALDSKQKNDTASSPRPTAIAHNEQQQRSSQSGNRHNIVW